MTEILVAVITGGLALVGVVITNISSNNKIRSQMQMAQAVTETKIEELTREVRIHNNFAQSVPIIEEQVKVINHRIKDLEESERHEKH